MFQTIAENLDLLIEQGTIDNYEYLILHNNRGYRCGYIKVDPEHPWFGKDYDNLCADVHGGITFGDTDVDSNYWWIGFDCSHAFDAPDPTLCPNIPDWLLQGRRSNDIRSTNYVREEITKLICQAELSYSEK